jgi:hypothetical protein
MKEIKLCKDCKHYIEINNRASCTSIKARAINFVDGKPDRRSWRSSAVEQREEGFFGSWIMGTCGIRARFFEPKEDEKDQKG